MDVLGLKSASAFDPSAPSRRIFKSVTRGQNGVRDQVPFQAEAVLRVFPPRVQNGRERGRPSQDWVVVLDAVHLRALE